MQLCLALVFVLPNTLAVPSDGSNLMQRGHRWRIGRLHGSCSTLRRVEPNATQIASRRLLPFFDSQDTKWAFLCFQSRQICAFLHFNIGKQALLLAISLLLARRGHLRCECYLP